MLQRYVLSYVSAAVLLGACLEAVTTITVGLSTDTVTAGNDVGAYTPGMPGMTDLRGALNFINFEQLGPYVITFSLSQPTITLSACLPVINTYSVSAVTINGSNGASRVTINGNNLFRGLFVRQADTVNQVFIQNLNIKNCVAQGGRGGAYDGGGGLGAGGGLFVGPEVTGTISPSGAGVIVSNVAFTGCQARGGAGSSGSPPLPGTAGAGGGGMGGNGGDARALLGGTGIPGSGGGGGLLTNSHGGVGGSNFSGTLSGGGGGGGGLFGIGGAGATTTASAFFGAGGGGGGASPFAFGGDGNTGSAGGSSGTLSGAIIVAGGGGGGLSQGTGTAGAGGGVGGSGFTSVTSAGAGGGGGGSSIATGMSGFSQSGGAGGAGGGGGGAAGNGGVSGGNADVGGGSGGGSGTGFGTGGSSTYGGGGGGAAGSNGNAGAGGFGGGGGGSGGGTSITNVPANGGGFGGGGGGAGFTTATASASGGGGGFGAGGGGGINAMGGISGGFGGLGGGNASSTTVGAGGAGAGLGGAIFSVGSIEIQGGVTTAGNLVTATTGQGGAGGGMAAAADIFILSDGDPSSHTNNTLAFNPTGTTSTVISSAIGDDSSNTLDGTNSSVVGTGSGVALVKNGTGTVALNGVNTYIGGTTINAGTLSINLDSALGLNTTTLAFTGTGSTLAMTGSDTSSRPVMIPASAIATFASSATFTISGQMNPGGSTTGELVSSGPGRLYLTSSPNLYSGGTTLNLGLLGIFAPDSIGTGSLTFSGSSTLQFLNPMTLEIPGTPAIAILTSSVSLNTTANFDPNGNTVTISTPVTGSGNLAMNSTSTLSTLNLTAANTYTGFTGVSGGTVNLIGSITSPAIVGNGGLLNVLGSLTATVASNAQDGGILNVTSTGLITGPVTILSRGILKGAGVIAGAVTIQSGGQISPGSSIGTLTITNAPYVSLAGSLSNFEINAATNSQILVTGGLGTASVAGNVNIQLDSHPTLDIYTLLTADAGLSGSYSGLTFSGPLVDVLGTLRYTYATPGLVQLVVVSQQTAQERHLTGNRANLFTYLNREFSNPTFSSFLLNLYLLGNAQFKEALDSLNPARNGDDEFATMNLMYSFAKLISNNLSMKRGMHVVPGRGPSRFAMGDLFQDEELFASNNSLPRGQAKTLAQAECESNCFWIAGVGDWARQKSTNQLPEFDFQNYGAFFGYDCLDLQDGLIGLAGGYARTNLDFENHQGSGHVNSYILGPYGESYIGNGYVEAGLFGSINQNSNSRQIFYPGFDTHAKSSHNSYEVTAHLGFGYDAWQCDYVILEPFALLDYVGDWVQGYTEKGAGFVSSQVRNRTIGMLRSEGGLRIYSVFNQCWGVCVLKETLGFVNKTPFGTKNFVAGFIGMPGTFTFETFTTSENLFNVGFEMLFKGTQGLFASFTYDCEFFSGYLSNEGQVTFGVYF